MISFFICLVVLIAGYFLYGKLAEKIFGINPNRTTPAYTSQDKIDYIPMNPWRVFMVQFLNIAGVGPVFGAIMGAKFGIASFLWITLGSVFLGGVHDFFPGMISIRKNGVTLPEIHGDYLGSFIRHFMRIFLVFFSILVGVVFVLSPAMLLDNLTPQSQGMFFWILIIFIYYIIATLLPIDKIIGKIYPLFGICLLFMAVAVFVCLIAHHPHLPEFWDGLQNKHPQAATTPIFPVMFITIACGAVSGFHSTQSSLMARCITNEKYGRPVFFGSMITEGIVALIWAAVSSYFFYDSQSNQAFPANADPAAIVNFITQTWLGKVGAIIAVLGVVFAPISTGDTAFRSARIMLADILNLDQKSFLKRLYIAVPLFAIAIGFLIFNLKDADSFNKIWRYFACCNQIIAVVTFWAVSVYLVQEKKCYFITLLPAIFMTVVTTSFLLVSPTEGFGLSPVLAYSLSGVLTALATSRFYYWKVKYINNHKVLN